MRFCPKCKSTKISLDRQFMSEVDFTTAEVDTKIYCKCLGCGTVFEEKNK